MLRNVRFLLALVALVAALLAITTAHADSSTGADILPVPYRSQFDGSAYAGSNCGPTAIAMVLEAYGQDVPTQALRDRANQLLGIYSPSSGTRTQDLARVVREHGLATFGLYYGQGRSHWTLDDIRREVQAGRPVVMLTFYPALPNHHGAAGISHYIVIVGLDGDNFLFNDSATKSIQSGYRVPITAADLGRAWAASSVPYAAFSVASDGDGTGLAPVPPRNGIVVGRYLAL